VNFEANIFFRKRMSKFSVSASLKFDVEFLVLHLLLRSIANISRSDFWSLRDQELRFLLSVRSRASIIAIGAIPSRGFLIRCDFVLRSVALTRFRGSVYGAEAISSSDIRR
jgi:hypothetical protein